MSPKQHASKVLKAVRAGNLRDTAFTDTLDAEGAQAGAVLVCNASAIYVIDNPSTAALLLAELDATFPVVRQLGGKASKLLQDAAAAAAIDLRVSPWSYSTAGMECHLLTSTNGRACDTLLDKRLVAPVRAAAPDAQFATEAANKGVVAYRTVDGATMQYVALVMPLEPEVLGSEVYWPTPPWANGNAAQEGE